MTRAVCSALAFGCYMVAALLVAVLSPFEWLTDRLAYVGHRLIEDGPPYYGTIKKFKKLDP